MTEERLAEIEAKLAHNHRAPQHALDSFTREAEELVAEVRRLQTRPVHFTNRDVFTLCGATKLPISNVGYQDQVTCPACIWKLARAEGLELAAELVEVEDHDFGEHGAQGVVHQFAESIRSLKGKPAAEARAEVERLRQEEREMLAKGGDWGRECLAEYDAKSASKPG